MKALTIWQPWATLLMMQPHVKRFETRSWAPPASLIGKRVALHAAARKPVTDLDSETLVAMAALIGNPCEWGKQLPTGACLGTATLAGAYRVARNEAGLALTWGERVPGSGDADGALLGLSESRFGDYSTGRWLWHFTDKQEFPEPIRTKGMQGLWNWKGAERL